MKPDIAYKHASNELVQKLISEQTGFEYTFREFTYGVLVPNMDHPLVNVSVANSSLSIDVWKGCSLQCVYCHVQDSFMDISSDLKMPTRITPRSKFSIDQILDELEHHPYFIADETVLSIGTASTEPFARQATASTFEIMEKIAARWKNPIWIVTKAGFPKGMGHRLEKITATNKVMLSFCWAGNPVEIEPATNDRFANIEEAHKNGATCAWYMRPLTEDWGASAEHIDSLMKWVIQKGYDKHIDMIVPGGLRWTYGIQYGIVEVHQLEMPRIAYNDNEKDLGEDVWLGVNELCARFLPEIPIYRKSSCALSLMLSKPDIKGTYNKDKLACLNSRCPEEQRNICANKPIEAWPLLEAQQLLDRLAVPCTAISIKDGLLESEPSISSLGDAIQTTLKKMLATGPTIFDQRGINF